MPTKAEMQELINNCTWKWTTQNGVKGYKVEGPNGNSIFLPSAGYRYGSSLGYAGSYGHYWSSTPSENIDYYAYYLNFNSDYHYVSSVSRYDGLSVRPVSGGGVVEPEQPSVQYATVTTSEVTEITSNSAICGGNVTTDNGSAVTAKGVCWSTNPNPTIEDNKTTDGSGVGSFTSQIPNLVPNTQYYVRAYATNEAGTSYGEQKSFTTLTAGPNNNNHEYVDLGLPSGLLWATCNVGANAPEEYGDYFAWGETSTKSDYSTSNSATYRLSNSELQSQGYIDSEGKLTAQYDAATANWGGDWRMPTKAEQQELLDNCTWIWTTQNGVNGYKVTSKVNSNYIFLPAAGIRNGSSLGNAGIFGYYWSSTPYESSSYGAFSLDVGSDDRNVGSYSRFNGPSVRPVLE